MQVDSSDLLPAAQLLISLLRLVSRLGSGGSPMDGGD